MDYKLKFTQRRQVLLLQNQRDGAQPMAIFSSLDQSVELVGDVDIPNHYNKTELDSMVATTTNLNNYYNKTLDT